MQPVFLDWDRPLLPIAADFFVEKFSAGGRLDMRRVTLALPGRRAINRLEELLAERAESMPDPAWYPPEFLTLGHLPEKFYELANPAADDLTQCFAWLDALDFLQKQDAERLAPLLPNPPSHDDFDARLALGTLFAKLHQELAADALDFISVAKICRARHLESEARRWQVLAELQKRYHDLLDSLSIWDIQSARTFAIRNQRPEEFERISQNFKKNGSEFFLVGLVDLNLAQKAILKKFERFVTPLVFAPEKLKQNFDEFGCLVPERWQTQEIVLDDSQIELVDQPEQQADAVLRRIAALAAAFDKKLAGDEIVIGVPNSQVIPYLEQRFEQAEIESRHFEGTPTRRTSVFRFLDLLCRFLKSRLDSEGFSAYAELIRHPDVEAYLSQAFENPVNLLTELDEYHALFLPETVGDDWREYTDTTNPKYGQNFESLRSAWRRLKELLGNDLSATSSLFHKMPVRYWTRQVAAVLNRLYGTSDDTLVAEARQQVDQASQVIDALPAGLAPQLTLPETLRLLRTQLEKGNIPPHEKPGAVEMIGWLEIVMDDAPVAVITGMNDGFVPSFLTSDLFLPDKVRQELGIEDNKRRYARDAYALSAILGTRSSDRVTLISGRLSAEGDPLLPSRLFFTTDDLTVAKRVRRFFGTPERRPPLRFKNTAQRGHEKRSAFTVPELPVPEEPPQVMRVTEFADYVRCPYRYFLKNRLKLEEKNDDTEELDGRAFGTLIHATLETFAVGPLKNSDSAEDIARFLAAALQDCSQKCYGERPRPAVAIQLERALKRLEAFATWQAAWRNQGWQIRDTEYAFNEHSASGGIFLDVDGREMFLRGRMDRIDVHEKTGELYVLDYKTADTAADPMKTYRKRDLDGNFQWVDFQLPLYHYILSRAERSERILLGHVALPKDVTLTGLKQARWTREDIDEAVEEAKEIVRRIRYGDFPKVEPPPRYSEAFAAICLDGVFS